MNRGKSGGFFIVEVAVGMTLMIALVSMFAVIFSNNIKDKRRVYFHKDSVTLNMYGNILKNSIRAGQPVEIYMDKDGVVFSDFLSYLRDDFPNMTADDVGFIREGDDSLYIEFKLKDDRGNSRYEKVKL